MIMPTKIHVVQERGPGYNDVWVNVAAFENTADARRFMEVLEKVSKPEKYDEFPREFQIIEVSFYPDKPFDYSTEG